MSHSASHLIIGASSSIARAAIDQLLDQDKSVIAVSRQAAPLCHDRLTWLVYEPNQQAIAGLCAVFKQEKLTFSWVGIFLGQLHSDEIQPEKRLEDFDPEKFGPIIQTNTVLPVLWIKHLLPTLKHSDSTDKKCVISACSARVGSISDNALGGWYSYRASKAALNMMLKNISIELARRLPNTKIISFHPGTTDSPLSKPFQARVAPEKLFSPDFVADKLLNIIEDIKPDGQLSYLDWDNKKIEF